MHVRWRLLKLELTELLRGQPVIFTEICDRISAMTEPGLTSCFPYYNKRYFVAKPAEISNGLLNLSLEDHKFHRFMRYLDIEQFAPFFQGGFHYGEQARSPVEKGLLPGREPSEAVTEGAGVYWIYDSAAAKKDEAAQIRALEERASHALSVPAGCDVRICSEDVPDIILEKLDPVRCRRYMTLSPIGIGDYDRDTICGMLDSSQFQLGYAPEHRGLVIKAGASVPADTASRLKKNVVLGIY